MRYGTTGLVILLMIVSGESIYAQTLVTGGTAYRWWNMSTLTATTNQTAEAGLNDGNVAVDVTLGGDTGAQNYQAAGLIWATNQNITSFSFTQGTTGGDGWWTNAVALQIQSFNGTTWTAISGWSLSPTYPYGPSASGTYTFVGPSISARGIRVVGVVHNIVADSWWAILREVSASYLAPTATPVATLTPTFTPLPATETPTSTAFPPTATSTAIPPSATALPATTTPTAIPPSATALPATTIPTAIPTVVLAMSAIITSTTGVSQQLADFSSGPDSNLFLFLAAIVIGFWFFAFIKEFMTWRIFDK